MKRFGKRKLRLTMQLKVFKDGDLIHRSTKQKKASIRKEISVLQTQNPNKWCIRVVYGRAKTVDSKNEEIENAGEYETAQELLFALNVFTEKSLLDNVERWIGGQNE